MPVRPDYPAVEAQVEQHLRNEVPAAFRIDKLDGRRGWLLTKVELAPGAWPQQDYAIWITEDARWIVATYGNSDVGMGSLHQRSLTMSTDALRLPENAWGQGHPLAMMLRQLLSEPSNQWGYT